MGFPSLSGGNAPTGAGSSGYPQLGSGTAPNPLAGIGFHPLQPELIQDSLSPSAADRAPSVRAVVEGLAAVTAVTNLAYTASASQGIVTSDTGTDATIPLADGSTAGLMSPAGFNKLAGIQAGAQVNAVTSVAGRTGAVVLTASDVSGLAAVATSGAYADLSGRPALAAVALSGAYADLSGRPALAAVATSGAYSDLTGAPTIGPGADPLTAQVFG